MYVVIAIIEDGILRANGTDQIKATTAIIK